MRQHSALPNVQIPPVPMWLSPLALGGSVFGAGGWEGENRANLLAGYERALAHGIRHLDTASDYGGGASERLIGELMRGRRGEFFVASKAASDVMDAGAMVGKVDESLARLQTDVIDLYYIHWPRAGQDMRPLMEGLETARAAGKIRAIGVSNFSVEQMEQVAQVGRIDAHQLGYNLFWRVAEAEVIPYCREQRIAIVTYSSLAQGVLTGKYGRLPALLPGDQRASTVHFEPSVWPHIYTAVEELKLLAAEVERPLAHLAIRWVLSRPGINTAVVGAKNGAQVDDNAAGLAGEIPDSVFARMTEIGDEVMRYMPPTGNVYRYYP
jgi:aryl-alcohol dehydrogenase-like predicted oxidoreductase